MTIGPDFRPSRAILELGDAFYDPVEPADFPQTIIRFRNDRWAAHVGLADLDDAEWIQHFGRFRPLPGSLEQRLALRYHGHQFRVYNPDLSDGRGFLFAQFHADNGRLLDLGTKGSGQTPYSRFADGRLTLKGGVREVLATEMLEALGVDTSKSFSLIETGEALQRSDEPSPTRSSVLVRLSHSHIRYGTFQRFAYFRDAENMERLVDYVLRHYLPGAPGGGDRVAVLMDHAVSGAAKLVASYMAAGFVHGVLNTDNINITGESFDYGPYRFAPIHDPRFIAAYFDQMGLYSYGRQAEALHWNVYQLALALRTIAPAESLTEALNAFPERYEEALRMAVLRRLGVKPKDEPSDLALLQAMETALTTTQASLPRFYFDWYGGRLRGLHPAHEAYQDPAFKPFREAVVTYEPAADLSHPYFGDAEPCSLLIDEIEAIWSAIDARDDWAPFNAKIAAIRRMGEAYGRS